jgi:hypothetical protein
MAASGQLQSLSIISAQRQLPGVKQPFGSDNFEPQELNVSSHQ